MRSDAAGTGLRRAAVASGILAIVCGAGIPTGPFGIIPWIWLFVLATVVVTLPLALAWAARPTVRLRQMLPLVLLALWVQTAIPLAIYAVVTHRRSFDRESWTVISIAWMMRLAVMVGVLTLTGLSFWIARRMARRSAATKEGE